MSDVFFTPTTEQVRDLCELGAQHPDLPGVDIPAALAMFDRWLEFVKREAAAVALEEAATAASAIIARGDVAEVAGFPPGTTGLREAISLRDWLHEEPVEWLRERATTTRTPGEETTP